MPSIISATTTSGLVSTADNSGSLQLATNSGTTALTIDTSQRVGIGATSPDSKLHVKSTVYNTTNGLTLEYDVGTAYKSRVFTRGNDLYLSADTGNTGGGILFQTAGGTDRAFITSGGNFQFNSGYGSVATAYGCRAWVNFNGTGTPAIRVARNVSSITDFGDMYYGINFSTAMPDANYVWSASGSNVNNDAGTNFTGWGTTSPGNNQNTTALNIRGLNIYNGGANQTGDCALVNVAIFR